MLVTQGRRQRPPHLQSVAPISCLASRLLHTSNIVFKNVAPLAVFGPPAAKPWRRACGNLPVFYASLCFSPKYQFISRFGNNCFLLKYLQVL